MHRVEAKECVFSRDLQTYFREISETPLLSADEERELAAAVERGEPGARNRMVAANLRLVVRIARDYLGRGMVLEDLIGEGNLGLIRAVEEFDPRFGVRFSTYAAYWIKQAIRHALINTTATIRLPAHMVGLLTKWRRAERALTRAHGVAPTFEEIADHLDLSPTRRELVAKALTAGRIKLESAVADEDDYWSPDETADADDGPWAAVESSDERADLTRRLRALDDRERMILVHRHGLGGVAPLTLKEIGERLGITREWVRKIETRAVEKLAADTPPVAPVRKRRASFAPASTRAAG